jgi:hypothetical protein
MSNLRAIAFMAGYMSGSSEGMNKEAGMNWSPENMAFFKLSFPSARINGWDKEEVDPMDAKRNDNIQTYKL